jgi:polysaccharide biosynthesis protein PslH
MRILVVSPFLGYLGADGGRTVIFNTIRNLSARHEVLYLSFATEEDLAHLPELVPYCVETLTVPLAGAAALSTPGGWRYLGRRLRANLLSLFTCTPVVAEKCRSRAMSEAIRSLLARQRPDVVHLFFPQMARYVEECGGVPTVMDTSDAALLGVFRRAMTGRRIWSKLYYLMQWLFWVRYESRYFPRFGKVLSVTRQDAAAINLVLPELDVYGDAVAVEIPELPRENAARSQGRKIGFLASFSHRPNVDAALYFADSIFPLVRKSLPDAEFVVAGKNPPASLAGREAEGISCVGFVPEVSAFYSSVDLVAAPLRFGGGIKLKVLEAMACGKAVVATSVGAEGIAGAGEKALAVADTAEEFAAAVVALLDDAAARNALGESARQLIERRFSWGRFMTDLDAIYSRLVQARR